MAHALVLAGGAVRGRAVDAQVKVVGVGVAGRLRHHALGPREHRRGRSTTSSFGEQTILQVPRDEEVLHAGVAVGHELGDELPVARVVETKRRVGATPLAVRPEPQILNAV